jgi:hypothetical protein
MSLSAEILSLSYGSAVATKTSALKTDYLSVRLIKNIGFLNPKQPSYVTNILLCGNCVDPTTRNLYVFYIDTFYGSAWIIEINVDTRVQSVVYYDKYNAIGFDPLHKFQNAKVVFGRLVWTDNNAPIYQMDIKRAKNSFYYKIGYGQYPNTAEWNAVTSYGIDQIVSNGNYFYKSIVDHNVGYEPWSDNGIHWARLCMIEDAYYSMNIENFYFEPMPPKHAPVVQYYSDVSRQVNSLRQTLFQIAYRYVYMDWRRSTFSPASIVPMPNGEEETATGLANEMTSLNNALNILVNTGGEEVRQIEIVARSSSDISKWFLIKTIDKFSVQEKGGEISGVVKPSYVGLGLSIPYPNVMNGTVGNPSQVGATITIPTPTVVNHYLTSSILDMHWNANDYGIVLGQDAVISIFGGSATTLTSFPSWITVFETIHNTPLSAGATIINGQTIGITPSSVNTGPQRSGIVVITDVMGNSTSIMVTQYTSASSPTVSILINPLEAGGMTLSNTSGSATNGSPDVDTTFTPDNPAYGYNVPITIYYSITKNGANAGSGNILVSNKRSNTKTLVMTSNAAPGDAIIVYLISSIIIV